MTIKTKLTLQFIVLTVVLLCIAAFLGRIDGVPDRVITLFHLFTALSFVGLCIARILVKDRK